MTLAIRLGAKLEARLRKRILEGDETLSEFVRKAVEARLEEKPSKKSPYEMGKHLFGRRGSGKGDLSLNSEKYFREYVRAKHSR